MSDQLWTERCITLMIEWQLYYYPLLKTRKQRDNCLGLAEPRAAPCVDIMANYYHEARAHAKNIKHMQDDNRRRAERRAEKAGVEVRLSQILCCSG